MNAYAVDPLVAALLCAGALQSLALAVYLAGQRRFRAPATLFLAVLLAALALRMGKSSLNALVPLDPWLRNLGLAGMLAVGPAAFGHWAALTPAAPARWGMIARWGFLPALVLALGAAWVPNAPHDAAARAVYAAILIYGAAFIGAGAWLQRDAAPARQVWISGGAIALGALWAGFAAVFVARSHALYVALCAIFAFASAALLFAWLALPRFADRYARLLKAATQGEDTAAVNELLARLADPAVYCDPDMNLTRFARRAGVPAKQASEALNLVEPQSFRRRLNRLRIDAAKRELAAGWLAHRSLTELAVEVGYNSSAAFARAFRQLEGCAPSEWAARAAQAEERG